jgi:hypothetical protein
VLIQTDSFSSKHSLGHFLVFVIVSVFVGTLAFMLLELYTARRWIGKVTHAFKIRYEGKVQEERGVPCIASFPGKFEDEWSEVVALGSEEKVGAVSVACVYLPLHTPRFGQHVNDPATGRCYCESIYGKRQAW